MTLLIAFASGLIFGLGLLLSGMSDPAKVLGFLDLAGRWDPSLAFVMLGAIAVAFIGFRLADRRQQTLLGQPMSLPVPGRIDPRLLAGSALFGIGWGLAGICPAPALVLSVLDPANGLPFVGAMLAGMALHDRRRS